MQNYFKHSAKGEKVFTHFFGGGGKVRICCVGWLGDCGDGGVEGFELEGELFDDLAVAVVDELLD